jgi:hypothetical protein
MSLQAPSAGPVSFTGLSAVIAMIAAPTGFTGPFSGAGGLLNSTFPRACTVGQGRSASRPSQKSTATPDGRSRGGPGGGTRGCFWNVACTSSRYAVYRIRYRGCRLPSGEYLIQGMPVYVYEYIVFDIVVDIEVFYFNVRICILGIRHGTRHRRKAFDVGGQRPSDWSLLRKSYLISKFLTSISKSRWRRPSDWSILRISYPISKFFTSISKS